VRPLTRRRGPNDLNEARLMVSTAEREALDQAEQLRQKAEAIVQQRSDEERQARQDVAIEVDGLRAELEQVTTRAAEAESALERLQAEWVHNGRPDPVEDTAGPDRADETDSSDPADDNTRPALTLVKDEVSATDASYLAEFVARMTTEAERLVLAARSTTNRVGAEADPLLKAALAAIERDTIAASSLVSEAEEERQAAEELRHQAQREHRAAAVAREEAQSQLREARTEAERVLADACASRDRILKVRQELAAELVSLRNAMDAIRDSLNRFIAEGGPAREAIDLRELTDLGQRQRRI
jgi:hypothetical protein